MTRATLRYPLPVLAALLALTACGPQPGAPDPPGAAGDGVPAGPYQVAATVLESPEHGPQLCHATADSYPPQCGGPDIVGWDWDAVDAESAGGTTWGHYLLVGTWDGTRFTLTEPPRADDGSMDRGSADVDLTSPCPEPPGGWQPVDPATTTDEGWQEAISRASGAPDFAGAWLDQSYLDELEIEGPELEAAANDPARFVLNLMFTGDLDERERWIREVWGGALCVSAAQRTEAELLDIQRRLHDDIPGVQNSAVHARAGAVVAQVFVATPELQLEVDDRYGAGAVVLDGWLRPVPDE